MNRKPPLLGILALQGDFHEHQQILEACGAVTHLVRVPADLTHLDALVLPGGESTTQAHLLSVSGLLAPLAARLRQGLPTLSTCAGLILLSRHLQGQFAGPTLPVLDILVERNAYGRQLESFEAQLDIPTLAGSRFPAVFIRAPRLLALGPGVEILAKYQGNPVAISQPPHLALCFHPELTSDRRLHQLFLDRLPPLL